MILTPGIQSTKGWTGNHQKPFGEYAGKLASGRFPLTPSSSSPAVLPACVFWLGANKEVNPVLLTVVVGVNMNEY